MAKFISAEELLNPSHKITVEQIANFAIMCGEGMDTTRTMQVEDMICKLLKQTDEKPNNGWIKIESEADLPKEYGNYHVKYLNGQSIAWFNDGFFYTMKGYKFKDNHITHYQPIEKPKPPIY